MTFALETVCTPASIDILLRFSRYDMARFDICRYLDCQGLGGRSIALPNTEFAHVIAIYMDIIVLGISL